MFRFYLANPSTFQPHFTILVKATDWTMARKEAKKKHGFCSNKNKSKKNKTRMRFSKVTTEFLQIYG